MKLTDKLTQRFGADKLLHLLIAALFVSQFDDYGLFWGFLALFAVSGLGYAKEKWLDKTGDWEDLKATVIGGVIELVVYTVRCIVF